MIQTVYSLSEADYMEAQKIWCSRELKKLPARWVLWAISILVGGYIGWTLHFYPGWFVLVVAGSYFAVIFSLRWRRRAVWRYQYGLDAANFYEVAVSIDELGFRITRSGRFENWTAWEGFSGWREGANVFILGKNLQFFPLTKNAFTLEQQQELRAILTSRFGANS